MVNRIYVSNAESDYDKSKGFSVGPASNDRYRSESLEDSKPDRSILSRLESNEGLVGIFKPGRSRITSGAEVQESIKLLNLLIEKGFIQGDKLNINSVLDGADGKRFEALVKNFQRTYNRRESNANHRVEVDGLVGKYTIFAMQAALNSLTPDKSQIPQSAPPEIEQSNIPGYVHIKGTNTFARQGYDKYVEEPDRAIRKGDVKYGGPGITKKEIDDRTVTPSVVFGYEISRFQDSMNTVLKAEGMPTIQRTGYIDEATKQALRKLKDLFVYEEKLMPWKVNSFLSKDASTDMVNQTMFLKVDSRAKDPDRHIALRREAELKQRQDQLEEQKARQQWAVEKLRFLEKADMVYAHASQRQGSIDAVAKDYPGREVASAQIKAWGMVEGKIERYLLREVANHQINAYATDGLRRSIMARWVESGRYGLGRPESQTSERQQIAVTTRRPGSSYLN